MDTLDTLSVIFSYLSESYIYVAPVCKTFLRCWDDKPKTTRAITKYTTINQLEHAFKSGLDTTENLIVSCSSIGRLDLVICSYTHVSKYGTIPLKVCEEACKNGHIDVVKWFLNETKGDDFRFLVRSCTFAAERGYILSLIHISEPTRPLYISYAVFCLKKKK